MCCAYSVLQGNADGLGWVNDESDRDVVSQVCRVLLIAVSFLTRTDIRP